MYAVPIEGEGANGETVGVAADDGVGVLLGNVTGGVLWADENIVCLGWVSGGRKKGKSMRRTFPSA